MAITMKDVSKIEIPDNGYRELEYIYFGGGNSNAFMDMGTYSFHDCYELHVQLLPQSGVDRHDLFGYNDAFRYSYPGYVGSRRSDLYVYNGNIHLTYGYKETSSSTIASINASPASGTLYNRKLSIKQFLSGGSVAVKVVDDDTSLILVNQTANYSNDSLGLQTAGLFSAYRYDDDTSEFKFEGGPKGYLYSFKVRTSENGQILQDWVPAQRKIDNVIGIYDKVNGTFVPVSIYTSQGISTDYSLQVFWITAGPVVSEDPDWIQKYEVKKIVVKSSNTMIWGSQAEYPYRRLEYVHFSGAEYFDTQFGTKQGYYREVTFALNQLQSGNSMIMGSLGPSSDNNNLRRCYNCLVGSDGRFRYTVGNASSSWQNASNLPLNTKRVTYFNIQQDNSTYNAKMNWGLKDASGNTLVSGSTTAGATGYLSNTSMSVMANNSDGNRDSFAIGNVYEIIERQTSSTGNLKHRYIPCQRKSDNVCGFYDVVDATFRAITGTNVTTTAAGPIVNEYWDLTV